MFNIPHFIFSIELRSIELHSIELYSIKLHSIKLRSLNCCFSMVDQTQFQHYLFFKANKNKEKLPIITLVTKNTANNTMYGVQETQSLNEFYEIVFLISESLCL